MGFPLAGTESKYRRYHCHCDAGGSGRFDTSADLDDRFKDMSGGNGGEGALMKTGGDRRVWLSVHNWFSVGWEKLGQQGSTDDWWGG